MKTFWNKKTIWWDRKKEMYKLVLILYISQNSQGNCLHVHFQYFKLALWPTLRQRFMNFWSFLTCPGDKHDEKISNCASLSSRFCCESHDFLTFLTTRPPISWFLVKYHSEMNCFVQSKWKCLLLLRCNKILILLM